MSSLLTDRGISQKATVPLLIILLTEGKKDFIDILWREPYNNITDEQSSSGEFLPYKWKPLKSGEFLPDSGKL